MKILYNKYFLPIFVYIFVCIIIQIHFTLVFLRNYVASKVLFNLQLF